MWDDVELEGNKEFKNEECIKSMIAILLCVIIITNVSSIAFILYNLYPGNPILEKLFARWKS